MGINLQDKEFYLSASHLCFWLIIGGAFAYTVGIFFGPSKKFKFSHMVWHLCVVAGLFFMFWGMFISSGERVEHIWFLQHKQRATKTAPPFCGGAAFIFYRKIRNQLNRLRSTPAATAEPITPATLGPMACIRRKLEGFSF